MFISIAVPFMGRIKWYRSTRL